MSDDLEVPAGSRTSSDPIEDGILVVNAAFAPGHDEHEVWRTPTDTELAEHRSSAKAWAIQSAQARRAMLRIERDRLLVASDWTELPSAQDRLSDDELACWAKYRQELRDLPAATVDADRPEWPAAPVSAAEVDTIAEVG